MTAPRFTIHDSARGPDVGIWFAVPAGFIELPVDTLVADPDSAAIARLRTALNPLVEALPEGIARQQFIAQLAAGQQLALALREIGTVHCSIGLHRDDTEGGDGRTLLSLFTVSWQKTAWCPRAISAARAVATAEHHSDIEYIDLPCGPASIGVTVRTPAAAVGVPQAPLLQIHAYLPHPDGRRMAVLSLSTAAVSHREHYRVILREVASMVSFENPLQDAASE